jgi:hypothetical protein
MQPPVQLTPEQQSDVEARVKEFRVEYLALVEKHQVDFTAYPQFVPMGNGAFTVVAPVAIYDKKYQPVKSPFSGDTANSTN